MSWASPSLPSVRLAITRIAKPITVGFGSRYFVALVFVAYVYIWRKGGFDWTGDPTPNEAPATAERERELEEAHHAR